MYIIEWHNFLETSYAHKHVNNWDQKLSNVLENMEIPVAEHIEHQEHNQEEWMLLAEFHKTNKQKNTLPSSNYSWNLDSIKCTVEQIGEMPSWIVKNEGKFCTTTNAK